jgi:hypothetical protein
MSISINREAEHLQFIHDRLRHIYAEDPRLDYMVALQGIIDVLNKPETLKEKLDRTRRLRFTV